MTSYTYKTGQLTEGVASELKTYDAVYVYCSGTHTLKIYIDGTLVGTHSLTAGATEVAVPSANMLGYNIQLELTGAGIINELDYVVSGRNNGD